MDELISVLIPVYNVEQYLKECIESVLHQSYQNIEVILVNDGSSDYSGKICDEYAQLDDRVKVIHQENKGVSASRNIALEHATGKYISFVDSDDIISRDFLSYLFHLIKDYHADMACCEFVRFSQKENMIPPHEKEIVSICHSMDLLRQMNSMRSTPTIVLWNKLYRKELFQDISFPENRIHEDEYVSYLLIDRANTIAYSNQKLYYYRNNPESIMGKPFNQNRLDVYDAMQKRMDYYIEKGQSELYEGTIIQGLERTRNDYYRVYYSSNENKNELMKELLLHYKKLYQKYTLFKMRVLLGEKITIECFYKTPLFYLTYRRMKDLCIKK